MAISFPYPLDNIRKHLLTIHSVEFSPQAVHPALLREDRPRRLLPHDARSLLASQVVRLDKHLRLPRHGYDATLICISFARSGHFKTAS